MTTPELTERQRRILRAIVEDYVSTAEPVGSKAVAGRHVLDASPATIRNDMVALEELGFLEQPHTSAGRVPSDAGYRYYVDWVLEETPVPDWHARLIDRVLGAKMRQVESLILSTVHVLSQTSSLISIVLGPQFEPASLVRVEVAPAGAGRALLALISNAGFVETKLVDLPASLDPENLRRMTELINGLLVGRTWEGLDRPGVLRDLKREFSGYETLLDETIEFLRSSLEPRATERVYISGVARVLDLPEFRDLERTKAVLGLLDREQTVSGILAGRLAFDGATVTIGRENKRVEMADCSLVSAPYHAGGRAVGGVAVLGPKRMDYGLVLALVDLVAANLDEFLGRLA